LFIELYLRTSDVKSDYYLGKEVSLRGWIHRIRKQKENSFLLLRDDRGGVIQIIFPSSKTNNLTIESSIEIKGIVHKDTRAPEGDTKLRELQFMCIAFLNQTIRWVNILALICF
jgi:aspartyl/asparaginyl-tRNA synthetase